MPITEDDCQIKQQLLKMLKLNTIFSHILQINIIICSSTINHQNKKKYHVKIYSNENETELFGVFSYDIN